MLPTPRQVVLLTEALKQPLPRYCAPLIDSNSHHDGYRWLLPNGEYAHGQTVSACEKIGWLRIAGCMEEENQRLVISSEGRRVLEKHLAQQEKASG